MPAETNILSVPKASEKLFERGFKTWCENTAIGIRSKLGLESGDPLSPYSLAEQLNVQVVSIEDLTKLAGDSLRYLTSEAGNEWSAVTVQVDGKYFIVLNPQHSPARRSSDLMHELSHIIREHDFGNISWHGDYALRSFDTLQELEANWFASALLLTKDAVFKIYDSEDQTAALEAYGVSKSLYNWRLNTTGVRVIKERTRRLYGR